MLACGMMETQHAYIIVIGKSLARLLLSRPRRWDDNKGWILLNKLCL
jgi:hypothetical protein